MRNSLEKARTADGTNIVYHLRNPGGTRHVALVHSLAMDHSFWDPVAERLSASASILTYDCRGHGASDKPPGPYTVELFARDLADLMDHIGWPTAAWRVPPWVDACR